MLCNYCTSTLSLDFTYSLMSYFQFQLMKKYVYLFSCYVLLYCFQYKAVHMVTTHLLYSAMTISNYNIYQ